MLWDRHVDMRPGPGLMQGQLSNGGVGLGLKPPSVLWLLLLMFQWLLSPLATRSTSFSSHPFARPQLHSKWLHLVLKDCHDTGEKKIQHPWNMCFAFLSSQNQTHITSLEMESNFSLKAVLTDRVKNRTTHPQWLRWVITHVSLCLRKCKVKYSFTSESVLGLGNMSNNSSWFAVSFIDLWFAGSRSGSGGKTDWFWGLWWLRTLPGAWNNQ